MFDAVGYPGYGLHVPSAADIRRLGAARAAWSDAVYMTGFFDGHLAFHEPMVTRTFFESLAVLADGVPYDRDDRDAPGVVASYVAAVPQPRRYPVAGLYPQAYRIAYDSRGDRFAVSCERLAWRDRDEPSSAPAVAHAHRHWNTWYFRVSTDRVAVLVCFVVLLFCVFLVRLCRTVRL